MTQVSTVYRWRTCDLDRLPDIPWLRFEIIDGELIVLRRPHLKHAEIITRLLVWLYPFVQAQGGKVLPEPGLVWSEEAEDSVIPDIAVVLPDRLHLATGRALSGTPNIAIEVVSEGSRTIDYNQKHALYARTGAQEYWIVDRFARRVEVWRFTGDHPTSVLYGDADVLITPLLPELTIPVHEIWP